MLSKEEYTGQREKKGSRNTATAQASSVLKFSLVIQTKSEFRSPGRAPLSSPGLAGSPTAYLTALRSYLASESVVGCAVLKNVSRSLGFCLTLVVAFSSLARVLEECLTIHSPPAFFF